MSAAKTTKVKLNPQAVAALFKGNEMQQALQQKTDRLAGRANAAAITDGTLYKSYTNLATHTWLGLVVCGNYKARIDNAYHNTLLKIRG